MKIIDSFLFFNEFDILRLRTEYLKDVVDYFLICECKYTFSGKEKPYYLDDIIDELDEEVRNKIVRLYYEPDISDFKFGETDECDFQSDFWKIEFGQRDFMGKNLQQFSPDDLLMLSDVDEIPNKTLVEQIKTENIPDDFLCCANFFGFYFNFTTLFTSIWPGTVFTKIKTASKIPFTQLRWQRGEYNCYDDGGWHFTYLGDVKTIQNKIESFSHQEYNKEEYRSEKNILECMRDRKDLFGRNDLITEYDFNNLPHDLRKIIVKVFPEKYYKIEDTRHIDENYSWLNQKDCNLEEYILNLPDDNIGDILGNIPSAWNIPPQGHKQFIKWLIEYKNPEVIVELGVDYGYSSLLMSLYSNGQVYGIDRYDDNVDGTSRKHIYDFVLKVSDKLKCNNFNLIDGDFTEVSKTWNKSIDILHIDGHHSYDACKNDYEMWNKFVNPEGVILFHDTVTFKEHVGKFFDELKGYYKINFLNSNGLGVASKDENLILNIKKMFSEMIGNSNMKEPEVITKPEYLHNNMPPLLEASLNPDGTGGTEIMGRAWQDYVLPAAPDLADWHWCVIPGDNIIAPDNSNIVWLHPHHNEPNLEQLMDKQFQKHFKAYVFVSNWQYERFGEKFGLPMEKCYVLKNATQPFEKHEKPPIGNSKGVTNGKTFGLNGKLQLIFHPNPIRGLDLLLEAIRLIPDEDFELHIFHELDVNERKKQYAEGLQTYEYAHVCEDEEKFLNYCLELANADNRVIRHTRTNNSKIREQLMKTHIFAYPSYFQETSCICMIEALCAGCSVLSSNLAALPETGLGFARHYGYIPDRNKHIVKFASELKKTITEYREGKFDNTKQVEICNEYYSWDTRVKEWVEFAKELWVKDGDIPENLKKKFKWEGDLTEDIRYYDKRDHIDFPGVGVHPLRYDLNPDNTFSAPPEISDCNLNALKEKFLQVKDGCKAILEIGIGRNGERSFAHIFAKNKNPDTVYVGIDIEDRSFLNDPSNKIYTFKTDSSNYDYNVQLFKSLGVDKFDFIFIDGYHSINQVLMDWEYTNLLSDTGVVGFHDTTCHYGPNRFVKALDRKKWNVIENACPEDWGIGFAIYKNR